jgi:hypothetical protein
MRVRFSQARHDLSKFNYAGMKLLILNADPCPAALAVRFEWSRKYPMDLQCPVPQSRQMTSIVTLSNAFFRI